MLSQLVAFLSVSTYTPLSVNDLPNQLNESQATTVVSKVVVLLTVKFNITILSQPALLVSVST